MASDNYSIPWKPLDLTPGISLLMGAMNTRHQQERADENAATQRMFAEKNLQREDARAARDKQQFEQGEKDRRVKAVQSANELRRQGRHSEADMLLKLNGVTASPVTGPAGPPEVVTPMAAAAATQQPQGAGSSFATPMMGAAATMDTIPPPAMPYRGADTRSPMGQHNSGAGPITEEDELAHMDMREPAPSAAADLMPITFPGDPGKPTGAYRYTGPDGMDLGTFDPASEEKFRDERAGRVSKALGPMGEKVTVIADALARGDITQQEASALLTTLRAEGTATAKVTDREDKQTFQREENAKYRNEGLTFAQRKELANIMAKAKMAAAGAGPVNPGLAKLVEMKEGGATDAEIYAAAADMHLPQKDVVTPVQNVVRNAATAERAEQGREKLGAPPDEHGNPQVWRNSQAAAKGTQQIQRFHRVEERLKALIHDVETVGERIGLNSKEYVRRQSLSEAVAAALRPYNELSSTDASMTAERAILGPTGAFGHGWTLGADLQTLKHILAEAQGQQKVNMATLLRPDGGSQLAPALGGKRPAQQNGGDHPAAAPVGETRVGPDGKTYRKVGPNNWQPVQQ